MSRIRSVHPGLATDEEYMALSHAAARILPLLWCECDDQGVFEWKPLTLKARLLPAHNDDMGALLDELVAHRFIRKEEINGRQFGLVRNFRKYQRPKKPKSHHILPDEFRHYVGITCDGPEPPDDESEPVPHQLPTNGGKSPQMEDGGGNGISEANASGVPPQTPLDLKAELWRIGRQFLAKHGIEPKKAGEMIGKWRKELRDDDTSLLNAFAKAEAECVQGDVVAYLQGCVKARLANGRKPSSDEQRDRRRDGIRNAIMARELERGGTAPPGVPAAIGEGP